VVAVKELWVAVGDFWKGFVDVRSRTGVKPFWLATGFVVGMFSIAVAVDVFLITNDIVVSEVPLPTFVVTTACAAVTVVPLVSMVWRRLLDSGLSVWWLVVPLVTLTVSLLLTENTAGESWVPFATVFFAVATAVVTAMVLFFLLKPGPSVATRWAAPISISAMLSLLVSFVVFPVVTTDGVINYTRVSETLGLGSLWERGFPTSCGEFTGTLTNLENWANPNVRPRGWGRVDLFTTDAPDDRLACLQSHTRRDTQRGFLYQRADNDTWFDLRDRLVADGFRDVEVWGSRGLILATSGSGEEKWSETEMVFYGDSGTLLYVWTDDHLWLRDTYRLLPSYLGGMSEFSGAGVGDDVEGWTLGDLTTWACSDFVEMLDGKTGYTTIDTVKKEEWINWGAPSREDEPDDYLLCSHSSPDDFHSGRVFRLQKSSDGEAEYQALVRAGFEEVWLGEVWGLFRDQTFEPSEDSHGGLTDELYLFADDGWAYFATIDDIFFVDDPYLDIPRFITTRVDDS
jgi:uncharacterized membrane protein YhaH (DUF805 family)